MQNYYKLKPENTSQRLAKQAAMGDSSVDAYLQRLGVAADTIAFVNTITDSRLKQQVIGYLRKFPQTGKEMLVEQATSKNKQTEQQANTPQEMDLANRFQNAEFQKWLLVNLRKARNEYNLLKKQTSDKLTGDGYRIDRRGNVNFTIISDLAQSIYDWYVRGVLPARRAFEAARTPEEKAAVANEYGVTNANTNLAGLTFDQADDFADNWHKVIAGEGEGLEYYGEKREDIVYGPQWKDPQNNGWTIKQVTTKNNLRTEGTKMGHCVGKYCDDVISGDTRIFSLRDPSNTPYVTMEVNPDSWEFGQIYGNGPKTGNVNPSKKLKAMIGEWMQILENPKIAGEDYFEYESSYYKELDETLENSIYKGNDYGLEVDLTNWDFNEAYQYVYGRLENRGGGRDGNDGGYQTPYVAKILARAAVDSDTQAIERNLINEKDMISKAMSFVYRQSKHRMMPRNQFKNMSIENKQEYVKDYINEGKKTLGNGPVIVNELNGRGYWNQVLDHAFDMMSLAKEFDINKIKSFADLDANNQKRFLAMAIDSNLAISQAINKRQANEKELFSSYDDSYLDIPAAPEPEDYKTDKEYKKAYAEWEEEEQKIRDEAMDDFIKSNIPYCLDSEIIENIQELLMKKPIKLPKWISKYFKRADERLHYPQILWLLESIKNKKSKLSKEKRKSIAFGWYGLCKISAK